MSTQPIAQGSADYYAALSGVVFYPELQAGYLRISGPDQVAFLQRQTTNDLNQLTTERSLVTVLTSPTARILDVFRLVIEDQAIGVIPLPSRAVDTAHYLKSRIFFMDKVNLDDASQILYQVHLYGPKAGDLLQKLGADSLPDRDGLIPGMIAGVPLRIITEEGFSGPGYHLLIAAVQSGPLEKSLLDHGALRLTPESHHILRVEAGLPAADAELTEAYTPLEVGLRAAISDVKGCYTGQEIIARQITYDKITQHLVGLKLQKPVAVGAQLLVEDRPAGTLTSVAMSPRFGSIALGILKRPYHEPGTVVIVKSGDKQSRSTVVPLPFQIES